MFDLTVQQVKQTLVSRYHEQATYLDCQGGRLTGVTAPTANHILTCWVSLKLLLMAFVWRRGWVGSVRLLISNKQKVTSLKNWIIWAQDWLCGRERRLNYVGSLTGARRLAFEGTRPWLATFRADRGDSLAFRSLEWRCWADSCVIMLLPTRVGEKKSQVNARGEAARRHPAPEATPGPWDRWETDCWREVGGEACPRGGCETGDFTSLVSAA